VGHQPERFTAATGWNYKITGHSDEDELLAAAGVAQSTQVISHIYPLNYLHRGKELTLGKLRIVATLDGVYARIRAKVAVILLTQGVKTFLVSLFILYLFQILVGKHLTTVANFVVMSKSSQLDEQLDLDRPESRYTKDDELDQMVHAINAMRQRLKSYYLELEESEFRWKFALEGSGDGVWDWDLGNNKVSYSDHYKEMLGYSKEENWQDANVWEKFCHPDDRARVLAELQDYFDEKSPSFESEFRALCKDGHWIWLLARGMVVSRDTSGKPLRIIGTNHDITQQKAAEEREKQLNLQLLQATKMESIGHLTGGIAHDFNNILGAIMGYAELAQNVMSARPEVYGNIPRYMGEILSGSDRARELIRQMLLFSRLSPDMTDSPIQVVMLAPVVKEVVSLLRSSIPATISLNYEIRRENLRVRIQPVHLHQVMMNLGINARDAIGEYGAINFSVGLLAPDHQICSSCNTGIKGSFVDIAVQDSGTGIPEALLHSIFDPFFTTKEVGKGTGMGLSVVHGIVHQAGGHIIVESAPASGTTFHILLPAVETDEAVIAPGRSAHVAAQNLSGLKLMVVDDEKGMTSMLKDMLENQGATVMTFNDPLAAVEVFKKNPALFDLLITDESMPELSGMHLAMQLLDLRPDFPIILCTGYSDHATAEAAARVGIAGFMYKPLDLPRLLAQIAELAQHQLQQPG
jgi:PAS domain S-box-containing protein